MLQNVQTLGDDDNLASQTTAVNAQLLNLGEGVGGLVDTFKEFTGDDIGRNLQDTVDKVDKTFQGIVNKMGQGENLSQALKVNLADSAAAIVLEIGRAHV